MSANPSDAESQRADAAGAVGAPTTAEPTTAEPTTAEPTAPAPDVHDGDGSDDDADGDDGPSGVPAADRAAARLRDLDGAPVEQHVAIYEDAHRRLEEGLADLDER